MSFFFSDMQVSDVFLSYHIYQVIISHLNCRLFERFKRCRQIRSIARTRISDNKWKPPIAYKAFFQLGHIPTLHYYNLKMLHMLAMLFLWRGWLGLGTPHQWAQSGPLTSFLRPEITGPAAAFTIIRSISTIRADRNKDYKLLLF